jgi:hypothetical protein
MSEEKQKDTQNNASKKVDAQKLPPFKLTPDKPGQNPRIYSREQAAADWKMVEARLEARGITSGF